MPANNATANTAVQQPVKPNSAAVAGAIPIKTVAAQPILADIAVITPTALIAASGVLLAFLIGFYTLIARERKSPYLINAAVWILLVCMLSALLGSTAMLISAPYNAPFLYLGAVFLIIAVGLAAWRVYRLAIRLSYFVDTANPKHFPIARWFKNTVRRLWPKKRFEHNSVDFTDADVLKMVAELTPEGFIEGAEGEKRRRIQTGDIKDIRSIALRFDHHGKANANLSKIVLDCLSKGYLIQYLAASRHPIEFVKFLKRQFEVNENQRRWAGVADQIIVIDAYTPHFGFTDSVYQVATAEIQSMGVNYQTSTETYAGLHTAASIAFNQAKKNQNSDVRKPALIIYEDCYALSDLESVEQYRIFLRHVIPSERLWEGMFTVFIETVQADGDWNLLKSYVDAVFDLRDV